VGDTADDALARQIGNRFLRALHRGKHQSP
jgi:hypothetical protein